MKTMRKVRQQVARNPVARAVARQKLHATLVDQKIRLYMLDKGETCAEFMDGLSQTLATIGVACGIQKIENADTRVLRGGFSACQQMALADSYDPLQTTAIDVALSATENLNKQLTADSIQTAWRLVTQGQAQ